MSATFGKCAFCHKEARSVRLWGPGVCFFHWKNPPSKDVKKPVIEEVQAAVADLREGPLLQTWFKEQARQRPPVCEEPGCGIRLPPLTSAPWRVKATIAHIVPKRHFKSVQTHPLNRLFICKTPHHDDYDSSWDKATQMKIWPVAVERFQQFMHLITDKELRFLPPALRELTNR